jgi:hypothetical protein
MPPNPSPNAAAHQWALAARRPPVSLLRTPPKNRGSSRPASHRAPAGAAYRQNPAWRSQGGTLAIANANEGTSASKLSLASVAADVEGQADSSDYSKGK